MYGRYTQLSKFAKQFAASQRESARQGKQRKTLDIKEAKRRKSRTWSECCPERFGCQNGFMFWHVSHDMYMYMHVQVC